jgi:hypothetical protein
MTAALRIVERKGEIPDPDFEDLAGPDPDGNDPDETEN